MQVVSRLGGDVPVFIDAENWEDVAEELDDALIGDAELWYGTHQYECVAQPGSIYLSSSVDLMSRMYDCRRRPISGTSEPRGGSQPYVSSSGEAIVDIRFGECVRNAAP